jgi:hypothetical protein
VFEAIVQVRQLIQDRVPDGEADKGFVGNQSMTHREMTGEAGEGQRYSARANEVSVVRPHSHFVGT